jgi:hypothetical protein
LPRSFPEDPFDLFGAGNEEPQSQGYHDHILTQERKRSNFSASASRQFFGGIK